MEKNTLIKILTLIYNWARGKGWNDTIIKIILGIAFGIAATFTLTSCSVGYKSAAQELNINIIPVEEWQK